MTWRRGSVVRLDQSIDSQGGKIGTEFPCTRFILHSSSVDEGRAFRNVDGVVERAVGCRACVCLCSKFVSTWVLAFVLRIAVLEVLVFAFGITECRTV